MKPPALYVSPRMRRYELPEWHEACSGIALLKIISTLLADKCKTYETSVAMSASPGCLFFLAMTPFLPSLLAVPLPMGALYTML